MEGSTILKSRDEAGKGKAKGKIKTKLDKLIKDNPAMTPRDTNEGFNWVIGKHGQPLPRDRDVEEFYCGKCRLCISAEIELLPATRDTDDPGMARITVDIVDCDTGARQETLVRETVEADEPEDGGATRTLESEYSCGDTDFYEIRIDYGAIFEKPGKTPNDKGAGSVRIRVGSIRRRRARR